MRNVLFRQNPEADGLLALRGCVSIFHGVQYVSCPVVVLSRSFGRVRARSRRDRGFQ
jgi:hypothetical protein